mgnify:CR=1 FL=1
MVKVEPFEEDPQTWFEGEGMVGNGEAWGGGGGGTIVFKSRSSFC